MTRQGKVTPKIREAVAKYRSAGLPARTIARMVGLSAAGVRLIVPNEKQREKAAGCTLSTRRRLELDSLSARLLAGEPDDEPCERRRRSADVCFEPAGPHVCPTCHRRVTFSPCVACVATRNGTRLPLVGRHDSADGPSGVGVGLVVDDDLPDDLPDVPFDAGEQPDEKVDPFAPVNLPVRSLFPDLVRQVKARNERLVRSRRVLRAAG